MGKNAADIKLTANSGIELPLPNPKDVRKVLILGNTIGFFGYPGEGCNISNIHGEDAKRFAWMYNCALLGVEFEILGEEEEFDYYSDLFQKIKERYGYEAEALFTVMKGNDDYDCKLNEYIEEMEDTGKKRFDFAIMNPPYDRNLHLKFLEKVIKVADKTVCIHPAKWLQYPTRERPAFLEDRIENIELICRENANKGFDINEGDLVITTVSDKGFHLGEDPVKGEVCCFRYSSDFSIRYKEVAAIWDKIKSSYVPITDFLSKVPSGKSLRMCITRATTQAPSCNNKTGGDMLPVNAFRIVSKNKDVALRNDEKPSVKFLNFKTQEEWDNAFDSFHTLFVRFCIAMDESVKLCPYMGDYTKPWTNARFCEYFGITGFISDTEAEPGSEWETILETMKKYA